MPHLRISGFYKSQTMWKKDGSGGTRKSPLLWALTDCSLPRPPWTKQRIFIGRRIREPLIRPKYYHNKLTRKATCTDRWAWNYGNHHGSIPTLAQAPGKKDHTRHEWWTRPCRRSTCDYVLLEGSVQWADMGLWRGPWPDESLQQQLEETINKCVHEVYTIPRGHSTSICNLTGFKKTIAKWPKLTSCNKSCTSKAQLQN